MSENNGGVPINTHTSNSSRKPNKSPHVAGNNDANCGARGSHISCQRCEQLDYKIKEGEMPRCNIQQLENQPCNNCRVLQLNGRPNAICARNDADVPTQLGNAMVPAMPMNHTTAPSTAYVQNVAYNSMGYMPSLNPYNSYASVYPSVSVAVPRIDYRVPEPPYQPGGKDGSSRNRDHLYIQRLERVMKAQEARIEQTERRIEQTERTLVEVASQLRDRDQKMRQHVEHGLRYLNQANPEQIARAVTATKPFLTEQQRMNDLTAHTMHPISNPENHQDPQAASNDASLQQAKPAIPPRDVQLTSSSAGPLQGQTNNAEFAAPTKDRKRGRASSPADREGSKKKKGEDQVAG